MEKDLSTLTVKELQAHLRKLGLKISGNKPDLIKRIHGHNASNSKYLKMKVPQLKSLLKDRNLSQIGRKAELVSRLEASDAKKKVAPKKTPSPKRPVSPKKTPSPKRQVSPKKTPLPKRRAVPKKTPDRPTKLLRDILHNLSDKDLDKTCRTDKEAAQVCKDDLFWKERIVHAFGYDVSKYKESKLSYLNMYNFFRDNSRNSIDKQLINAVLQTYWPIAKYLIQVQNADMYGTIKYDVNAFGFASNVGGGDLDTLKIMVSRAAPDSESLNKALQLASLKDNLNIFKYLVSKGADAFANFGYYTPFTMAVDGENLKIVRYVVKNLKPTINELNDALGYAVTRNSLPIVKLLVNSGADDIDIALRVAKKYDSTKISEYLEKQLE